MPRWPKRDIAPIPTECGKRLLIPLTRGLFAKIDAEDLPLIGDRPWHAYRSPSGRMYACQYSCHINGQRKISKMHRVILGLKESDPDVDHANREETLNNTRENLRPAEHDQNQFNTRIRSDCQTGFKGVHLHKPTGGYMAYINYNGRRIHLGYFKEAIPAARARDIRAIKLHGEFSSLNFSRSDYEGVESAHAAPSIRPTAK